MHHAILLRCGLDTHCLRIIRRVVCLLYRLVLFAAILRVCFTALPFTVFTWWLFIALYICGAFRTRFAALLLTLFSCDGFYSQHFRICFLPLCYSHCFCAFALSMCYLRHVDLLVLPFCYKRALSLTHVAVFAFAAISLAHFAVFAFIALLLAALLLFCLRHFAYRASA